MRKKQWRIETPSGYCIEVVEGSRESAEEWAKKHYSVWRIVPND